MPYLPIKNLDVLMGGAAQAQFQSALNDVIKNIQDPTTSAKAKRAITLKVTFIPNEDRDAVQMVAEVSSKLAPREPVGVLIYLAQDDQGEIVAYEKTKQLPGQIDIYGEEIPYPNLVSLSVRRKGETYETYPIDH